ncbi:MAG: DUF1579 family protein [bacterium]
MTRHATAQGKTTRESTPQPTIRAEIRRLEVFVGTWHTEGKQYEGSVGPAAPVTAVETFEWLTGELFLIHRFQGQVGGAASACIEVIGYDPSTDAYPARTYYNNGIINDWQYEDHGKIWILAGEWMMGDERTYVRCTTRFSDDDNTRSGRWESSADGVNWQTYWDVTATRATIIP